MLGLIQHAARFVALSVILAPALAFGQVGAPTIALPEMSIKVGGGDGNLVESLKVMGLLTVLTLAPAIIISVTSFTRIIIVFGFSKDCARDAELAPESGLGQFGALPHGCCHDAGGVNDLE